MSLSTLLQRVWSGSTEEEDEILLGASFESARTEFIDRTYRLIEMRRLARDVGIKPDNPNYPNYANVK